MPDYVGGIVFGLIFAGLGLFIFGIWRKIRKRSGSATIMLGSMHNVLNEDMQRAAEVIVEREAGKKMEAEESGEGSEDDQLKEQPGDA
jgi:hypothetical protein